jgi:hypothetical protein
MERRRAPRYRYQVVEIEWGSALLRARTLSRHSWDVSAGGIVIESEDILWVGVVSRDCPRRVRYGWIARSSAMGVTVELRENESQRYYADLLARLAAGA